MRSDTHDSRFQYERGLFSLRRVWGDLVGSESTGCLGNRRPGSGSRCGASRLPLWRIQSAA